MSRGYEKNKEDYEKKTFFVIEASQTLSLAIGEAICKAERNKRELFGKPLFNMSNRATAMIRQSNNMQRGKKLRLKNQLDVFELLEEINDQLPNLRKSRCVSIGECADISKCLNDLEFKLIKWMNSDINILTGEIRYDSAKDVYSNRWQMLERARDHYDKMKEPLHHEREDHTFWA